MPDQSRKIDGKVIAKTIKLNVKNLINERISILGISPPVLSVLLVGSDEASKVYVRQKEIACKETGIKSFVYQFPDHIDENSLISKIRSLNEDKSIHGILLQLPLPQHINQDRCLSEINPAKDVDGLTIANQGKAHLGHPGLYPCTPMAVMKLLKEVISLEGKLVAVVGYSSLVGAPLTSMLANEGASVFVCHKRSHKPYDLTRLADVLVVATGVRHLIRGHWIRKGAVVIDVGIHRTGGKITGDVCPDDVAKRASWITPVPGGVGPVTVAMLMANCLKAWNSQHQACLDPTGPKNPSH